MNGVDSLKAGSAVTSTMGESVVAKEVSGCEVDCSSEMIEVDDPNVVVTGDGELLTETGVVVSAAIAGLAVVEVMVVSGTVDGLVITITVVSGAAVLVDGLAGLVAGLLVTISVTTVVGEDVVVVGT